MYFPCFPVEATLTIFNFSFIVEKKIEEEINKNKENCH
jgi:hypothetical protein